ncbi:MAG: lamin tail domain-containing protein [Sedimentisphaerales bacterium]|nr:lamin tail domain-containing protein [Sedimentisphaerales bacterium]
MNSRKSKQHSNKPKYWTGKLQRNSGHCPALLWAVFAVLACQGVTQAREGVRAYWPFDGNALDRSGNNIHGTAVGGAGFVQGKYQEGISIDSRVGQYLDLGAEDIAPPWSVSLWARKLEHTRSAALLNSPTCSLRLEQYANTQKVGFTVYGVADHSFNYIAPIDEWTHLVFIGTDSSVSLWADGQLQGSINVPIHCPMATISRSVDPLVAVIDDMAVLERILTASEIVEIYNAGLSGRAFGDEKTAWDPVPADKTIGINRTEPLRWRAPEDAVQASYNLYFGTDPDQWETIRTGLTETTFSPSMQWDCDYYWRVDVVLDDAVYPGTLWSFRTGGKATQPVPIDGAMEVAIPAVTLAWIPDSFVDAFKLYLGASLPLDSTPVYEGSSPRFLLEGLSPLTTYYWRVDPYVHGEPTIPGDLWSFTTRQKPVECPQADMDGDCAVLLQDLALFAEQWLSGPGSPADFTGANGVEASDFAVLSRQWQTKVESRIVIHEIHYDPDVKTERVEFVELHNTGPSDVDLSGWHFCDGITYEFPAGTILPAGGFLVVAEDPSLAHDPVTISEKFGTPPNLVYSPFEGKLSNEGEKIELCDAAGNEVDQVDYRPGFPWPTVGDPVPAHNGPAGSGASIQLVNPWLDNDLAGSWRSASPTPGAENQQVFAGNIPPHIRQVEHSPRQPSSGQTVTITAKVTDPDGVAAVTLQYQIVEPGHYIRYEYSDGNNHRLPDPEYETGWISLSMYDSGVQGDRLAGDHIYTVQVAPEMQTHRRLIRYRIRIEDTLGHSLRVPYSDDPQPNFAYFVYDGAPAWTGAVRPGIDEPITANKDVMNSLPIYHLIAKSEDIQQCQYEPISHTSPQAQWYQWTGALVYDGVVYDHIWYRNRGWWSAYAWGKNKWKFDFHRGHLFQARDNFGQMVQEKWDKLNFSACIQQVGASDNRGEQGMYEAVTFRLFQLAQAPASHTNWVHFRVIDEEQEATANQYVGDFWGLYLALEQPDGKFLDERELPDGNLYKMFFPLSGDSGNKNNQGPAQVTDHSDVENFCRTYRNYPGEAWWRNNTELDTYFSYRIVCDAVHHYDLTDRWNCMYYHHPSTGKWWIMPWDVDLSWDHDIFTHDDERWKQVLDYRLFPHVSSSMFRSYPASTLAFRNRARELSDLLLNPEQCGQLIEEYAAMVHNQDGGPSFVDADRALWDYHPRIQHPGRFYGSSPTGDFEGMVQRMRDFLSPDGWGGARLAFLIEDPDVPYTPAISYTGPSSRPANGLTFEVNPFDDPQGSDTLAATKWRIAEVRPWARIPRNGEQIVLIPESSSCRYFEGRAEPSDPADAWRYIGYNDDPDSTSWLTGDLPIGYGESFLETIIPMQYSYTTLYVRKTFEIDDPHAFESITLDVQYDDGFNAWINGEFVAGDNVDSQELAFEATARSSREDDRFAAFTHPAPGDFLTPGTNVIAVQLLNILKNSSNDCFLDLRLSARPKSGDDFGQPGNYTMIPGRYEIETVWESQEIADPAQTGVRIPADAVKPGRTYRVRCRRKDNTDRWSHWSDPQQFTVGEPLSAGILEHLRITELMYNPAEPTGGSLFDNDDFEFIELKNIGEEELDLSAIAFVEGVQFIFATSSIQTLSAGEFVLVVRNQQAFEERYGTDLSSRIAGQYSTPQSDHKLANDGERIKLADTWNGTIAEFEYNDARGWPVSADGSGHSLVPLDRAIPGQPAGSLQYGGNWRASAFIHGSPGAEDPVLDRGLVINEVMAHTDYDNSAYPEYDSNDWIELYNGGLSDLLLQDWYLSDDGKDLKKWRLPEIVLEAGAFVAFDEVTGFHFPYPSGFGLNKAGEAVFLSFLPSGKPGRVTDSLVFKGQESLFSLGRFPDGKDFFFRMPPTRAGENDIPHTDVLISEIMYHPSEGQEQYMELFNPSSRAIDLFSEGGPWRLNGGIEYEIPEGVSLGVGARLLLVDFDPAVETRRLDNFITTYRTGPLQPGVDIIGSWTGDLSNRAERIALEKPLIPDLPDTDIPWVIVEEVYYSDRAPWPPEADGTGKSLQRINCVPAAASTDPDNWVANPPSPGR